jgi:hypothetical protein
MTGSIHIADANGHTTRTWDTADPQTIREVEEVSARRRRTAGWSTARPGMAPASRSASPPGTLRSTPSWSLPHGWPVARSLLSKPLSGW